MQLSYTLPLSTQCFLRNPQQRPEILTFKPFIAAPLLRPTTTSQPQYKRSIPASPDLHFCQKIVDRRSPPEITDQRSPIATQDHRSQISDQKIKRSKIAVHKITDRRSKRSHTIDLLSDPISSPVIELTQDLQIAVRGCC